MTRNSTLQKLLSRRFQWRWRNAWLDRRYSNFNTTTHKPNRWTCPCRIAKQNAPVNMNTKFTEVTGLYGAISVKWNIWTKGNKEYSKLFEQGYHKFKLCWSTGCKSKYVHLSDSCPLLYMQHNFGQPSRDASCQQSSSQSTDVTDTNWS